MLSGVGLPALVAMTGVVVGALFALLKWFAGRLLADIDKRLARIDEIEHRVDKLVANLPLYYQRREDSIREYTALHTKIDRVYELIATRMESK